MPTTQVAAASDLQADFMNLLVTQLRNQNPLDPMNTNDMSAQLAQFSQLQQLETMNSRFGEVLQTLQAGYAVDLVGKEVAFTTPAADGTDTVATGTVSEVSVESDDIALLVDGRQVSLSDILAVTK